MRRYFILIATAMAALCLTVVAATLVVTDADVSDHEGSIAPPSNLTLESITDLSVRLSWHSPEAINGYWDDFEQHSDFAINSPGEIGWQYIDGDNRNTYVWNAGNFPGQGGKMAFVVMNGSEMSFSDGLDISTNPNFQPTSGKKMLIDFSSIGAANNDYLISPELSFEEDFQISFQARSYTVSYGAERVRVGYSTTGSRRSDFTYVTTQPTTNGTLSPRQGCDYLELPAAWTLIQYTIPAEARYVCVNCVSNDAFMFMMDDLFVGTNNIRPDCTPAKAPARQKLVGFNIYRNGQRLNDTPYSAEVWDDVVPVYGEYLYTVSSVYDDGTESEQSTPLRVNVADISLLPFEDDFSAWFLDPDKWSTPDDIQGNESRWRSGYYSYGLVNPAAEYSYSALKYYDQSLVSREMRTTDLCNTYLRFTVQHVCYQSDGVDYLEAEIKAHESNRWQRVATLTNEKGSFDRTVFEFPLSRYLREAVDGRFQIRFRAHGDNAQYIDYWYVDDVKVWNPMWGKATITVNDGQHALANVSVHLAGDNGSTYDAATDASGRIDLPQIEQGTYRVTISQEGYNSYSEMFVVGAEPASFNVTLTYPLLELSATSITADDMATETQMQHILTLANNGSGLTHWSLDQRLPNGSGNIDRRFEVGPTFPLSGDLQSSIVFDGEHFYTSSWYFLGTFYKYDREGTFIEQFSIPEMYYMVYDFAYDGRYVYASDYSNRIFQLDMDERRIVSVIDIPELPDLKITHLAYDPDRDGFWCGTFNTLVLIDRQGRQMTMEKDWDFAAYGSAYDNVTPGGPYLWVSDMTMPDDVIFDKIMLRQYSLNSRSYTGVSHVVNDMPGYINGSQTNGQNQVCGVTVTDKLIPGQLTLIGTLQQSPSLVYSYRLCAFDEWLNVTPMRGTLLAGETQDVTVNLNSLYAKEGELKTSVLTLTGSPAIATQHIDVSMHVTHTTPYPRPQQLTATVGKGEVTLTWQGVAGAEGYDVLRDDQVIGQTSSADEVRFTDQGVVYGHYKYNVRARYADGIASWLSDEVEVMVKDGAPYYAPVDLSATIAGNRDVHLTWLSPLEYQGRDFTLMWGTGANDDQLGVGSGYFYAGQKWLATDLVPYRNKTITAVNVRICAPVSYLAARIYQDGKLVARTIYGGKIAYGEYTTIELSRPVGIVPGCDYIVAVQIQAADGIRPLGMDEDPNYDGRGNLISLDGSTWYTAAQAAITGCFNISFDVRGSEDESAEAAPSGYTIYRDGIALGTTNNLWYDDELQQPGLHTYAVASTYAPSGQSAMSAEARVRVLDIQNRVAPARIEAHVVRNRMVTINWEPAPSVTTIGAGYAFPTDLTAEHHTQRAGYPEYLQSWPTRSAEMAVASDGRYVYTSTFNESGRINVYDLMGNFIGKVVIDDDNLGGIRNLAWDGSSLWAADCSTMIHRLSVSVRQTAEGYELSGAVLNSYSIAEYGRHLAYIPELNNGKGGFEVGDWNTGILVSPTGAKLGVGPSYHAAAGTAYYDGCIYAFEQNNPLNSHCIAVYDLESHRHIRTIDLEQYVELTGVEECYAGGASTFQTADGTTVLALCLQFGDRPSRLVFLDLSGSEGVAGYNVYRDGALVGEGLRYRTFADTLTSVANYCYEVSTRYIDGTESPRSKPIEVSIVDPGTAPAPVCVQAQPAAYPYNVNLSFADAHLFDGVTTAEDFELGRVGQPFVSNAGSGWVNLGGGWAVTDTHYFGRQGLMAAGGAEAWLIIPVDGCRWMSFAARNDAVAGTTGLIEVYYSTDGDNIDDFIALDDYVTLSEWQFFDMALPHGTEYVIVRKPAECATAQFLDALRLHVEAPLREVYGYQIFRDGRLLTPEPVTAIHYTDHNLQQGSYAYQVRMVSMLSAESELSEPVTVELQYDNGGQPPVNVCAEIINADSHPSVQLTWDAPALGNDISLAWHDGRNHDAAGLQSGGAYWAAVRWAPSDLAGLDSLSISEVEIYVNQVPEALYVLLYEGGELRRQQRVERPRQYAFNRIALDEPLPLNNQKELRLVVYVEHNEITVPLGYDEGPCVADGKSNIYSSDGVSWKRLSDEDTGINANWNFGLVLQPYTLASARATSRARSHTAQLLTATDESTLNALRGYRVYVNRNLQHPGLLQATSYIDEVVRPGIPYLEYQVKAVYTKHDEVSAPIVRIQNPMQDYEPDQARDTEDGIEQISATDMAFPRYNLQGIRVGRQQGVIVGNGNIELHSSNRIE